MAITCSTNDSKWHQTALSYSPTENKYKSQHLEMNEEFIGGFNNPTNGMFFDGWFSAAFSGASATVGTISATTAVAGRPGVWTVFSGTASTGFSYIYTSRSTFNLADETGWIASTVEVPQLSNGTDDFVLVDGWYDNTNAAPTDAIYFLYDGQNHLAGGANPSKLDKWEACVAKSGSRLCYLLDGTTACDGGFTSVNVPVSTTSYERFIVVYSPNEADFYVDQGSGRTKVCQITTAADLPIGGVGNATGAAFGILKATGTTAVQAFIDQMNVAIDLNAARSP
jgi:hypothetical protein